MLLYVFSIICALFLNTSLAPTLGFEAVTTSAFLPMMILVFINISPKKIKYNIKTNKEAISILAFAFVIFVFKIFIGENYFKLVLTFLIMPILISIYFDGCSKKKIRILQLILIVFFILECTLAIYEKILLKHSFPSVFENNEYLYQMNWQFRSEAFLGHPLANAMAVSVLTSFIITNRSINFLLKFTLSILGYISLFCFNARGAIIVTTSLIIPYLFYQMYHLSSKVEYKFFITLLSIIIISGMIYLILFTDFGGRFSNNAKLFDGSAMTRIDVFKFYYFLNNEDFLFGKISNYVYISKKLGAGGVENGIVVLILQYGIIFTLPLLILLFRFQFKKLAHYSKIEKWLLLGVFYMIGIMNPNLSTPIQWIVFIFAYYAFRNYDNLNIKAYSKINNI